MKKGGIFIWSTLMGLLILFVIFVYPLILTVKNIIALKGKDEDARKRTKRSMLYGFALFLLDMTFISSYSYDRAISLGTITATFHEPFNSKYTGPLYIVLIFAVISLLVLNMGKRLPPLAAAIFVSGIYGGMLLFVFCAPQLMWIVNFEAGLCVFYLFIYAVNFYVCGIRVIRETAAMYAEHFKETGTDSGSGFRAWLRRTLGKLSGWVWFPLVCLIPLTGLLICACIVLGQSPADIIKIFTETSEWRFSQMTSPPPVEYGGHYLCTVAANGHEEIVKPTRLGLRRGKKIVVNRQLCAANAFEQLIEDKTPRFHRFIRHVYDKYGYPISKHITTKLRSDIVYIIMKPLEWVFVIALYLFDTDPESRIAVQYTGRHVSEFIK